MLSRLFPATAILVTLGIAALPAHGQEPQAPPRLGYEAQLNAFFKILESGEFKEAIEGLYHGHPWYEAMKDSFNTLKGQFVSLPDLVGELHGYDLITQKRFADRFVYCWYVVAFDRQPLGFHFTFYKPKDTWYVYSFEYKDDIKSLAEEIAKAEILYGSMTNHDALTVPPRTTMASEPAGEVVQSLNLMGASALFAGHRLTDTPTP